MDPVAAFFDTSGHTRSVRATCFPNRRVTVLALLVCVAVPALFVSLRIARNPKLSPVDEAAHWDYVKRVAGGDLPRLGEKLEASTLRELVCRGTDISGLLVPSCHARHLRYDQFPGGAEQYEAQQPPVYYALTVPMRWFDQHVLGLGDLPATRVANIYWLVAGLLLLWCTGCLIGVQPGMLATVILFLVSAPLVLYHASAVSNDAASVFAGSLVAFVTAIVVTRLLRWRTPLMLATGFLVTFIKTTDGIAVGAVAAAMLVAHLVVDGDTGVRDRLRSWIPTGGALLLGGAVAAALWVVIQQSIAIVDPRDVRTFDVLRTSGIGPGLIAREAVRLFTPISYMYTTENTLLGNLEQILATLQAYLLIGVGLAVLFVTPRRWPHVLGIVSMGTLYLGGFVFGLGQWINYGINPLLSGRFGLSVGPLLILALAGALRGTWAKRAVLALTVAFAVQTLVILLA